MLLIRLITMKAFCSRSQNMLEFLTSENKASRLPDTVKAVLKGFPIKFQVLTDMTFQHMYIMCLTILQVL